MPFLIIQIQPYSLPGGAPLFSCMGWELSSVTPLETQRFFSTSIETGPTAVSFFMKPDGTAFYVLEPPSSEFTPSTIHEYYVPVPWDVRLAEPVSSVSIPTFHTATGGGALGNTVSALSYTYGLWFSTDGLHCYFIAKTTYLPDENLSIVQFSLSSPWDISTITHTATINPEAQIAGPRGVTFNPTGTLMFVGGSSQVFKYTVSTPWDITTAVYSGDNMTMVASVFETNINSKPIFNSTGTTMYAVRDSAAIDQYSLSTPWTLSSATYVGRSEEFNRTFDRNELTDMSLKDDTTIFVWDYYLTRTWEMKMEPEDITTLYITDTSYFADPIGVSGARFSIDGLHLYIISGNEIKYHTLSSPWDLTTVTYVATVNFPTAFSIPAFSHMYISPDGTKLYGVTNSLSFRFVYPLTMSTPYDITTATYDGSAARYSHSLIGRATGIAFSPDGTTMFLTVDNSGFALYRFTLSTPWVISNAVQGNSTAVLGTRVIFRQDGKRFFVMNSNTIYQYNLRVAWTLNNNQDYDRVRRTAIRYDPGATTLVDVGGVDDEKLFITGTTSARVYELNIESCWSDDVYFGWDLIPVYYLNKSRTVGSQDTSPNDVEFSTDGTNMYIVGGGTDSVYQYTLSTAWDVSTATYASKTLSVTLQETNPQGITFKPDGTKMYMTGTVADQVHQYTVGTPWDISTASYDNVFIAISAVESQATGMTFKPDGTKMYIVGSGNDRVQQYTLSVPWDLSSATYDNISSMSFSLLPLLFGETLPSGVVSVWENAPSGIIFKPDGTKMYISGTNISRIIQFTLTTPWDITTAVYDNKVCSLHREQDSTPQGFRFDPTGEFLYVCGSSTDGVYQYSLIPPF